MTDTWDPTIPHHKKVAHGIEVGDGIPEMRNIAACRTALQNVGFEICHEEDLADRDECVPSLSLSPPWTAILMWMSTLSEVKWYYALEGDIRKVQTLWDVAMCWRMTTFGKFVTQNTVRVLEKVGMVPKGTHDVGEALKTAATALVAGGQDKLFTPMMVRTLLSLFSLRTLADAHVLTALRLPKAPRHYPHSLNIQLHLLRVTPLPLISSLPPDLLYKLLRVDTPCSILFSITRWLDLN
jgi:hypothetical protein